ncbi:uncharacterized protein TM35_000471360 [Trypanosoma theileri]|uniref:Uncharacterized protein n=1 Tax=Trypanosoma theileri TaxID=67003 RepID=A0A1X0NI24_9TRYP|nr:uncharacterized protein TM35_000471360 [Trypanosoma theileri]ORC84241.1 hypothetical protein TM35_000471360 [Trypanosoma theileri]
MLKRKSLHLFLFLLALLVCCSCECLSTGTDAEAANNALQPNQYAGVNGFVVDSYKRGTPGGPLADNYDHYPGVDGKSIGHNKTIAEQLGIKPGVAVSQVSSASPAPAGESL